MCMVAAVMHCRKPFSVDSRTSNGSTAWRAKTHNQQSSWNSWRAPRGNLKHVCLLLTVLFTSSPLLLLTPSEGHPCIQYTAAASSNHVGAPCAVQPTCNSLSTYVEPSTAYHLSNTPCNREQRWRAIRQLRYQHKNCGILTGAKPRCKEEKQQLKLLKLSASLNSATKAFKDSKRLQPAKQTDLQEELSSCFIKYAMSTILGRALPDIRDGLKPVQRRILWAMHELGLRPEMGYRKCARVVGEVLGKYHPHGDQAVYDALVRVTQDFTVSMPLIRGHGNFGSIDRDPPAAMRYTECKLSSFSQDALLNDIRKATVNFTNNFDGNEIEPMVFPSRFPLLLLNGAMGIAVGMATNIPPHNLAELVDAVKLLIDKSDATDEELQKVLRGPDFPTGGQIIGSKGIHKLYTEGSGSIVLRGCTHIEEIESSLASRNTQVDGKSNAVTAIIITQLPYNADKSKFIESLIYLIKEKKLDGISVLRDESDRNGIRIVIELKREASVHVVLANIYKKTSFQTTFRGVLLALGDNGKKPIRFTIRSALQSWITFRFETLRRRAKHELHKMEDRLHIVKGLLIAYKRLDDIIRLIRKSNNTSTAKEALLQLPSKLSITQVEALLGLSLSSLTTLEENKLVKESDMLRSEMDRQQIILQNDSAVYETIKSELSALKSKYGTARKSRIIEGSDVDLGDKIEFSEEDMIRNESTIIYLTKWCTIKRMSVDEFEIQQRGARGKVGVQALSTSIDEKAEVTPLCFVCNTHDTLLCITRRGIAFPTKVHQLPMSTRRERGIPVSQLFPISQDDEVATLVPITAFENNTDLIMLTKGGLIKRTPLTQFKGVTAKGLIAFNVNEDDELKYALNAKTGCSVIIVTTQGFAIRFPADPQNLKVRSRQATGLKAILLREETDEIAAMTVTSSNERGTPKNDAESLLCVTRNGYGKRIRLSSIRIQQRGGQGLQVMRFVKGTQDVVAAATLCDASDSILLSTENGKIIRQTVRSVPTQSRSSRGVLIQKKSEQNGILSLHSISASETELASNSLKQTT